MKTRIFSWIILMLIMTLLTAACFGMDRKVEKHVIGGRTYYVLHYYPKVDTRNYVIWLPGSGERTTTTDGSDIGKVDLKDSKTGLPVTWTAQAAAGFEFTFHIFAIQIPSSFDYWCINKDVATYVKETLNANEIGVVGYSLGGRGAWYCLQGDSKHYINFISSTCGFYDFSQGPINSLPTVPVFSVHGDQDQTMSYQQDVATAMAYNIGRQNQIFNGQTYPADILITINGAGHNVWPQAYDISAGKDGLLQWVIAQFGTQPVIEDPIMHTEYDGVNVVLTTQGGKKINIKPISVQ